MLLIQGFSGSRAICAPKGHTDEPHPHVHLVLRATSEDGRRLNIRKATLRHWRSQFAQQLRELDVPANATERAVRGEDRTHTKDGIYRARLGYGVTPQPNGRGQKAWRGSWPPSAAYDRSPANGRCWRRGPRSRTAGSPSRKNRCCTATGSWQHRRPGSPPAWIGRWLAQKLMASVRARRREERTP